MNGKTFLDEKYGSDRVNGRGLCSILDEFAKLKIEDYKESLKKRESKTKSLTETNGKKIKNYKRKNPVHGSVDPKHVNWLRPKLKS
jgi:hypothetical protein